MQRSISNSPIVDCLGTHDRDHRHLVDWDNPVAALHVSHPYHPRQFVEGTVEEVAAVVVVDGDETEG